MDDMKKITDDLHVTVNKCQDIDLYLHKVLPINLETQIFKACSVTCNDNKGRVRLANYTSGILNRLLTLKADKSGKFDKTEVILPELKNLKKHLIDEAKDEKKTASNEEKKDGDKPVVFEATLANE